MLSGLLFFPVTPFHEEGSVDAEVLASHIERGIVAGAGAVFVACGTGEFHALSESDYRIAVQTAVEVANGRVEVVAGVGGALPLAQNFAVLAADAGADGTLVLPPYLVAGPPLGLAKYVTDIVDSAPLPAIVYQRNNAVFDLDSARALAQHPGVRGFKDGIGDIARVKAIREVILAETDREFLFFNGMPTAELSQLEYRDVGVDLYSSAAFAFAPEIALAFYRAYVDHDDVTAERVLDTFYRPFAQLRDSVEGYAVALIKAGMTLRGHDAGSVRPPLLDVRPQHVERLNTILDDGLRLADELALAGAR
ncbi:putative 5-dehydro-4-deoxyglucarate dehydratase [Microbacterium murale]|uniref:5-dehydro-4-deoxyglucarate dehydratase n=2 Tax=Microbacterium murale TaxID=1081040 RepID=A0ABQ1RKA7_9MICO|nr:putative 5-dehydro-4-deoxyglucarate dehydratase [Microbacterium murale]